MILMRLDIYRHLIYLTLVWIDAEDQPGIGGKIQLVIVNNFDDEILRVELERYWHLSWNDNVDPRNSKLVN